MRSGGRGGRLCALAVLGIVAGGAGLAYATTVERLALADLVARAERIVEGVVVEALPAEDLRGRPAMRVVVEVGEALKGEAAAVCAFLVPGGIDKEGVALVVPGMPRFEKDERVVLFVSGASSAGLRVPIGLGQGTFRAATDPVTKEITYAQDLTGLDLVDKAGRPAPATLPARIERKVLLERVRALVGKK